jgi:hypothetical protein
LRHIYLKFRKDATAGHLSVQLDSVRRLLQCILCTLDSCSDAWAGGARCINPGAKEFGGDSYDSNCNGNNDCFIAAASFGTEMDGKMGVLRSFRDHLC